MKTLINRIIDFFYEKKRVKKKYKMLDNKQLHNALDEKNLYVVCLKSRNNNFVSRMITKFSGPYSHVVAVTGDYTISESLQKKIQQYYDGISFVIRYLCLASADENGMNYFSLSEYQNREMDIFEITTDKKNEIISEFLSEKVMNMNYDYTGLVGQIFRRFGKWFYSLWDDERAYYCSEQAEIFKRHGVTIADNDEPTPTEIYEYCRQHYKRVYTA